MKKNIKVLLSFALAFVITVGVFYFYQKQENKQNENIQEKTKNEFCYQLEKDGKKRKIRFEEKEMNKIKVIEGNDIYFEGEDKKQEFIFGGFLKDEKYLIVFGRDKKNQNNDFYERRYKKYANGILEGVVEQDNYEKKKVEGKNFFYIKDKNKIKYDGKFAIYKVSCDK